MKLVTSLKNLSGKRIIVRVDYNEPIKGDWVINDARIKATNPTLKYLLQQKADLLLIAHLGRPQGKRMAKFSLKPIVPVLEKSLGQKVILWQGQKLERKSVPKGRVVLLENIRFWPEEEKNNQAFAKKLASLGDYYVNEAFSNAHREHASMVGIPKYLKSFAGLELANEVKVLTEVLQSKVKPKIAVLGGAKISTKIGLIKMLTKKMDFILIGGALANNFLKIKGLPIGSSVFEKSFLTTAKKLMNKKIILPIDAIVAKNSSAVTAESKTIAQVNDKEIMLDIGPETVKLFQGFLSQAKLIVWNGPIGYLENPLFREGDGGIISALKKSKAQTVVGGGETLMALDYYRAANVPTFISLAGGAMLEFLTKNGKLPGLQSLK